MLMDLTGAFIFRSGGVGPFREARWLESLHLGGGDNEFQQLTTKQLTKLIPENASGFKALIKLPPAQAVELLYFSDSPSLSSQAAADGSDIVTDECLWKDFTIFKDFSALSIASH
ncbi:hypothetical protein F2Q69_00014676 [Brassica cretica]|uniref:Uncharacterized protein n=1 Tax=Brassica cretica TaxID=69181 RepID=A0A8S9QSQ4_BRACR|nr:hypothetical protein F2Q69_00014676 [Brassica cretica]